MVVVGHIAKALAEPIALRAMARGTVPAAYVERRHPRWWAEVQEAAASANRVTAAPNEEIPWTSASA